MAELAEQARIKKERLKREKEQKERLLKAQQAAHERVEERMRRLKEQEEARIRRQEELRIKREKQQADLERMREESRLQLEYKRAGDAALRELDFKLDNYVRVQEDLKVSFSLSTEDERWLKFIEVAKLRKPTAFFSLIPLEGETPLADGKYYSSDAVAEKLDKFNNMNFSLQVNKEMDVEKFIRPMIFKLSVDEGLVPVDEDAIVREGAQFKGWKLSFKYGARDAYFLMASQKARRLRRQYLDSVRQIAAGAKRDNLGEIQLTHEKKEALKRFRSIVIDDLRVKEREEAVEKKQERDLKRETERNARRERLKAQRGFKSSGNNRPQRRTGGTGQARRFGQ
jgi:hypothetical protein